MSEIWRCQGCTKPKCDNCGTGKKLRGRPVGSVGGS